MKKNWVRCLSLLLAGVMTLSSVCVSYAAEVDPGFSATVSDGYVVAQNYELTDVEKAIMMNAGVAGETLTFTAPSDSELVKVDAVNKTVKAESHTDEHLNVWEPVEAYVVEGSDTTKIDGFTGGEGDFASLVETENYTVKVKYQLTKAVDEATQKSLLNTPYRLVTAVKNFDAMAAGKDSFKEMTAANSTYSQTGYGDNIIQLLKVLADGNMKYQLGNWTASVKIKDDPAAIDAINALYTETASGTENLPLIAYLEDYSANYSAIKQAYVLSDKGTNAATQAKATYDNLCAIVDGNGMDTVISTLTDLKDWGIEEASLALAAVNGMMVTLREMKNAIAPTIAEDTAATQGLMADPANAAMTALIDAAIASDGSVKEHDDMAVVSDLTVAATYITCNVNRHDVKVTVKANVVKGTDDDATTELTSNTITLQIADGATYDDLVAEIAASGLESAALDAWADYAVNEDNYTRTTTTLSNVVEDTEFVITYEPNKYTLTLKESNGTVVGTDTVNYGYKLTLPAHENEEKSYDYAVDDSGYIYQVGDVVKVTKDTVVSRREGKAKESERLLSILAADYADTKNVAALSADAQAILNNLAVKSDRVTIPVPTNEDGLVSMETNAGVATVRAESYPTGITGMDWKAVGYQTKLGDTVVGEYSMDETFAVTGVDKVEVLYELAITNRDNSDTEGISESDIINYLNIPYVLVTEAGVQKDSMSKLVAIKAQLTMSSEIKTLLNSLMGDDTVSAATKTQVDILRKQSFADDGSLKLYGYVADYDNNGLSSYYKNYSAIDEQVTLLKENLPAIIEEPAFINLVTGKYDEYLEKLEKIVDTLNALTFPGPNTIMNLDGDMSNKDYATAVTNLLAILEKDNVVVTNYTAQEGLTKSTTLSKALDGKFTYAFTVNGYDVNGMAVSSKYEKVYDLGYTLTNNDITELENAVAALEAVLDTVHYEVETAMTYPTEGTVVTANANFSSSWTIKHFEAKLSDGTPLRDDITYEDRTIPLPAAKMGYKYTYTIKLGDEVLATREITNTDGSYTLLKENFDKAFVEGKLTIERTEVNISQEATIAFVNSFNAGLAGTGATVTLVENSSAMANLMKNSSAMAMVLRLTPAALSDAQGIAMGLANAAMGEDYIGLNGDTFWTTGTATEEGGLYLQALVDAVLESGIGMQSISDMINDKTGAIADLTLNGYTIIGGANVATFGGELMQMQVALKNAELPMYITLDETNDEQMLTLDKNIKKVQNWLDVNANAGDLNVVINDNTASDKLYELCITGLLLTGDYNDLADISDVDLVKLLEYIKTAKIDPLVTSGELSHSTIENTLATVGKDVDLTQYAATIDKVLNALAVYQNYMTVVFANGANDYEATANVTIDMPGVLGKVKGAFAGNTEVLTALGMIKDDTLVMNINLVSADMRDNQYQAMIIDNSKSGADKFDCTKDTKSTLAALANAGENAVVILLGDIEGNVVVNNGVIVNLNGKTIKGNFTNNSASAVQVFDTYFAKDGEVTGTVSGAFKIAGGKYANISADMLADGYEVVNGSVQSSIYTITEDANGNITIEVNAAFVKAAAASDIRTTAIDVAAQLGFNFYTSASFNIDGNDIYDVTIVDAVDFIKGSKTDIANAVIDLVDVEGAKNFVNTLIADFTAFQAMSNAITTDAAIAEYAFTTAPWDPTVTLMGSGAGNYLAVGIAPKTSAATTKNLIIKVKGDADAKADLAAVLAELGKIVTINKAEIDTLTNVDIVNGSIVTDAHGTLDVVVDLTKDARYITVIGTVLAYNDASLVPAVNKWINDGNHKDLKAAIDTMTTKEIIAALKAADNVAFEDMLTKTGISVTNEVKELERIFHTYLDVIYSLLNKFEIQGNNSTLPRKDYGEYGVTKTNWHRMDLNLILKMFVIEPGIVPGINANNTAYNGWDIVWDEEKSEGYIYIDLVDATAGITTAVFEANAAFTYENYTKVYPWEYKNLGADGKVATGTEFTVTVINEDVNKTKIGNFTVIVLGDVNCNGMVELADASLIRRQIVGLEDLEWIQLEALDINCNDSMDEVADASAVERRLVSLIIDPVNNKTSFLKYRKQQ